MGRTFIALGVLFAAATVVAPAPATHSATPFSVVFEQVTGAGNGDVILTDENGKPQQNLTAKSLANDSSPSVAPNRKTIVFSSDRSGRFALWIVNIDGGRPRPLTPSGGSDTNPSYSPDGKWIVFTCQRHGNSDICIVTSRGTDRRNLTNDSATELNASWSPDSKKVVYDRIAGAKSDIWMIGPKGGTALDITPNSPLNELDPSLSASGQLAFDAMDAKGSYDIYVTKPGSTQATKLTTDPAEDSVPVYSPDGKKLLFVSARTGEYEIFEMNADGSNQHDVSNNSSAANVGPNWGPAPTRALSGQFHAENGTRVLFPCSISGTTGNDDGVDHPVINGTANQDRVCARAGKDIAHGWYENDLIDGGSGNDTLYGDGCATTAGNPPHKCGDTIFARSDNGTDKDNVWGGTGSDTAYIDPVGTDTCHSDVEHCNTPS